MLITNHVLAGALVGHEASGPVAAFGAGVVSHAALDLVPHYLVPAEEVDRVSVLDGLCGLVAVAAVLAAAPRQARLRVAAGVVGACLPDLDKPSKKFFGRSPFPAAVDRAHFRMQTELPHLADVEVSAAAVLAALVARRSG